MQTSKVSASLLPPPSKVAATETVQPFIFGSLTVARPLGASGFESLVVLSPAVMTIPVTVFAVALMTVTEEGGPFRFGFCFASEPPFRAWLRHLPAQNRAPRVSARKWL